MFLSLVVNFLNIAVNNILLIDKMNEILSCLSHHKTSLWEIN